MAWRTSNLRRRLGFSLPLTLPGWLAKCTGFPGVLELKVTVMPRPRRRGDHSAGLAAHSPGPADRGPSVRCGPSSVTRICRRTPHCLPSTEVCTPHSRVDTRFPWSSSDRSRKPQRPRGRVLHMPGSLRDTREACTEPGSLPPSKHKWSLKTRGDMCSFPLPPVPRAVSCRQQGLLGCQPGSVPITL